jgi:hypothetical protein
MKKEIEALAIQSMENNELSFKFYLKLKMNLKPILMKIYLLLK